MTLSLIQTIELAKVVICRTCKGDCKHCPWEIEQTMELVERVVNQ